MSSRRSKVRRKQEMTASVREELDRLSSPSTIPITSANVNCVDLLNLEKNSLGRCMNSSIVSFIHPFATLDNNSFDSLRDECVDKVVFSNNNLVGWAIKHNITHNALSDLLRILQPAIPQL